ncbi:MAG: hypothetical protein ACI9LM_003414 [Alteromonadaceae bacterium]|jgi:hypothetical protein
MSRSQGCEAALCIGYTVCRDHRDVKERVCIGYTVCRDHRDVKKRYV